MSDHADSFFEKVLSDQALRDELGRCTTKVQVIGLAKSHGYEFSESDLENNIKARQNDLSPEDLENVAGGGWRTGTMEITNETILGTIMTAIIAK